MARHCMVKTYWYSMKTRLYFDQNVFESLNFPQLISTSIKKITQNHVPVRLSIRLVSGTKWRSMLNLAENQIQTEEGVFFVTDEHSRIRLDRSSKLTTILFPTFSPISVISPAGKTSISGSRAHALITCLYRSVSRGWPKSTFSLSVAFMIQACWGM